MTTNPIVRGFLLVLVLCGSVTTLPAQKVETFAYGGAIFPIGTSIGDFVNTNIWGGSGGVFITPNFELEGSFGYVNHFNLQQDPNPANGVFGIARPATRGYIYDALASWNFGQRNALGVRLAPYVTFGIGGLTAQVIDSEFVFITGGGLTFSPATGAITPNPAAPIILDTRDTFFTFSYGGGVKALNMWGPMGLRADVRGRTIPNFFGKAINWMPEVTGGVTFSWGER